MVPSSQKMSGLSLSSLWRARFKILFGYTTIPARGSARQMAEGLQGKKIAIINHFRSITSLDWVCYRWNESIWVVGSIRFSIIVVSWSDRTVKNLKLDLLGKNSGARLVDFTMLPRQSTSLESITRVWKRKELACQNQEIVLYPWRNQLTAPFGFSGLCIPYGDFPISNNAELSSVGGCTTKWRRQSVKIDMTPKLHRWKPNDSKTVIELIETVILPVRQDRYRCLLLYVSKRLQSPPVTKSTWRAAGRCIF